jgi:hypothetical protein
MSKDCNETPQNCVDCSPSFAPVLPPQGTSTPCPQPNPCSKITKEVCVKHTTLDSGNEAIIQPTSFFSLVKVENQGVNFTIANPTGTFTDGQRVLFRIKDNGTSRIITFGNAYKPIGVVLPTTTVANKILYVECFYNASDLQFDVVRVQQEV